MLKPTLSPPPSLAAAVRRLHHARPAAGHDRPAGLGEEPPRRARRGVRRIVLADPRRAEDRHRRPVDPLDGLEPRVELRRDPRRLLAQLVGIVMGLIEESPVLHRYKAPFCRVASIPITSSAASPR